MIVSLILAAVLPVVSKKSKTSDAIWHYVSNGVGANSDVYYGASNSQSAIIGNTSAPDSSKGSRLVIVTPEDSSGDTIQRSLIDFYQKTSTGMTNIGRIAFDDEDAYALDKSGNLAIGKNSLILNTQTTSSRNGNYNTAVGYYSLSSNIEGYSNTALGYKALSYNLSSYNTAVGSSSLRANTQGHHNTSMGNNSLSSNTIGNNNTAFGADTMPYNTTGNYNTAIGIYALAGYNYTRIDEHTGSNNTSTGASSLYSNISGSNNVANGTNALYSNTTGNSNVALGSRALFFNQTGNRHSAVGFESLFLNTSTPNGTNTYGNTSLGYQSLYSNKTGLNNVAIGDSALYSNNESNNTGVGAGALYTNIGGTNNTAIGTTALFFNTTGNNTAIGNAALQNQTSGYTNTALGNRAMMGLTTGHRNTAIGERAMYQSTTAWYNSAVGHASLDCLTTGGNNAALGVAALRNTSSGQLNIGIGTDSGTYNTTGSNNIFIGNFSGWGVDSSNKLYIENSATFPTLESGTTIPYTGSNALIYGDFSARTVRINGAFSATSVTQTSDRRVKNIIGDNKIGLERILKLNVKEFTFKHFPYDKRKHTGVIAQELQKIIPNAVVEGPGNDKYKTLLYIDANEILFTCVNAIKQLYAKMVDTNNKIVILDNKVKYLENENKKQKIELLAQSKEIKQINAKLEKFR